MLPAVNVFWCNHELSQKCVKLFKYGHEPVSADYPSTGGFATHCQLKPGTAIVRIPKAMPAEVAAPANCATATVCAAFRQAGEYQGSTILILGAGMLGLTATAMAWERGAQHVIVVDPAAQRGELARRFGATATLTDLASAKRVIDQVTDGRGVDIAFDFSGHNDAVQASIHFLRIGGQAVLVGSVFPTESISISPEMIVRRWLRIYGVHNYLGTDLLEAVNFLQNESGKYPFQELVTKPYAFTNISRAVERAISGEAIRVAIGGSTKEPEDSL